MKKDIAKKLLTEAQKRYDEAEVYAVSSTAIGLTSYQRELEKYSMAEDAGMNIQVRKGDLWVSTYTEKISEDVIPTLLQKLDESLEVAEAKPEKALYHPPTDEEWKELSLTPAPEFSTDEMMKIALELDELVHQKGDDIFSVSVDINTAISKRLLLNSAGLEREESSQYHLLLLSPVIKRGEKMDSTYVFRLIKDQDNLDLQGLVDEAYEKATAFFEAKSVAPGKYPIIMDQNCTASLISAMMMMFSADIVQKGMSMLKDKVGEEIASPAFTLIDDPLHPEGFVQSSFDGEGLPTYALPLIKNGKLETYLYNLETAAKDKVESNARAQRSYKGESSPGASTLVIEPGEKNMDELMQSIGNGLIITDLQGLHSGLDPISGDFSLPAKGFRIKDGKKAEAVNQITVASNFFQFIKDITEVGADSKLTLNGAVMPPIAIKEISVSGEEAE